MEEQNVAPVEETPKEPISAPDAAPMADTEAAPEEEDAVDYAALASEDMKALADEFPELTGKRVTDLDDPLRYAALRDLGLTPREAFLATSKPRRRTDNRAHLSGAVPRPAGRHEDGMNAAELSAARELFAGLDDGEIRDLYRKVTR